MRLETKREDVLRSFVAAGLLASALAAPRPGAAASQDVECLIEPQRVVRLSTAVEGVLESVEVDRGDRVKQGQIVATLESGAERASRDVARERASHRGNLAEADARVRFAERELARLSKLREQNVVAERLLDEATTNLERATADLEAAREEVRLAQIELAQAEAELERRRVRSPIDGVVTRRLLHPGEYVESSEVLEIAQIDPLRVEALLPAPLRGRIRPGSEAVVTTTSLPEGSHVARVTAVDPVIDAASGTFGVRLELPNGGDSLAPGLACRARFDDRVEDTAARLAPPAAPRP
ncbi:Cobalt-zinc-cadmium resistance protein CzcB [Phycisphaerales bacterium]|jgi:RND family efflux transporter MFP subunit|nr:Cobalt-zinc-cadmium resistance protein CzcB [Phycisphaerales bacterium]